MACKTCDELLTAYKREVKLFGKAVSKISGTLGDDSRLATQEAAHLLVKCRDASVALTAHWRLEHSDGNEDSGSTAEKDGARIIERAARSGERISRVMPGCRRGSLGPSAALG